jgi:hypothetical protein
LGLALLPAFCAAIPGAQRASEQHALWPAILDAQLFAEHAAFGEAVALAYAATVLYSLATTDDESHGTAFLYSFGTALSTADGEALRAAIARAKWQADWAAVEHAHGTPVKGSYVGPKRATVETA